MQPRYSPGRYAAIHRFCDEFAAVSDLTGSGDLKVFRVVHDKIQILEFGFVAGAAFPNSGTMTTVPVIQLDKTICATAVRAEITSASSPATRLSPSYSQLINTAVYSDLNSQQAEDPISGPPTYPTAVKGDVLTVAVTTSGVGGTQSARPYVLFREIEADA